MTGSDKAQFNSPSTTETFQFANSAGNTVFYVDGSAFLLVLQSGTVILGKMEVSMREPSFL